MTASLAVVAASLLCWPAARSQARVRALRAASGGPGGASDVLYRLRGAVLVVPVSAASGFVVLGPAGGATLAVMGAVGLRQWRAHRQQAADIEQLGDLADCVSGLVTELRAGSHPADAAERVGRDAPSAGCGAGALRSIASSARLGGDVAVALARRGATRTSASGAGVARLAQAWALATRHGVPLADVLDAVRCDLEASARHAATLRAQLAGPRTSAAVLAALPLLGLALGELIGAHPLGVLAGTDIGQVLVVIGGVLILAGVAWAGRITARGVSA